MLGNGVSWDLIMPLRMPSLLPHDLCHGQSSSHWPPASHLWKNVFPGFLPISWLVVWIFWYWVIGTVISFWYESTGKNVGLFITGHSEVYKEWVKVGERGLKSNSSDAEIGYIWEAPGLNHNNGWLKKQPEISASVRNSAHGKGHEEGGLAYAKAWSSLRKPPVPEHLPPKPESIYFTVSCSRLHLWLYGGLFPTGSLGEGVNMQLQVNKNSWAWQECLNLRTPLKVI